MSYLIGFFGILFKFIAFLMAFFLVAYLMEALLKTIKLRVPGVLPFVAFLGFAFYASGFANIKALVLGVVLLIAWLACIVKVRSIPKGYFEMPEIRNTADMSWASMYGFGCASIVSVIPAIEEALPWVIDGFQWYVYVCLALFAVMPIVLVNSSLEDIQKLKQILNGRKQIDEETFFDMVDALENSDDSPEEAEKKAAFIKNYLQMCKVDVIPSTTMQPEVQPFGTPIAPEKKHEVVPPPQAIIEINAASEETFRTLPQFGLALAKRAVQAREEQGAYRSVEEFYTRLNLQPHVIALIAPHLECEYAAYNTAEAKGRKIEF